MNREQEIDGILNRYPPGVRENLTTILQDVQEAQGHLSREAIVRIARHLSLPVGKVYGVATFYSFFSLNPQGKYPVYPREAQTAPCFPPPPCAYNQAIRALPPNP